ncbi:MAG: hypothetical protein JJU11_00405 [Candidatus Sumerlaeia bacterium]|nr:hypothetical protein [Candidatus Sumerlaeia bacterium]
MSLNPPTTRAVSMDFMRGVAILLILPVNLLGFTVGGYAAFWPNFPYDAGFLDHAAFFVTSFFVQGKVYPLLALMFG